MITMSDFSATSRHILTATSTSSSGVGFLLDQLHHVLLDPGCVENVVDEGLQVAAAVENGVEVVVFVASLR